MCFSEFAVDWLAHSTGITRTNLELTLLQGANSSQVFLIQDVQSAISQRFVLRVIDNPQWLAEEPDLAIHEASALREARRCGVCAPELIAFASHTC